MNPEPQKTIKKRATDSNIRFNRTVTNLPEQCGTEVTMTGYILRRKTQWTGCSRTADRI
jgi:hypothetical protein